MTEQLILEGIKFVGPAGAAAIITAYICTTRAKRNNNRNGFCSEHSGIVEAIRGLKEDVRDIKRGTERLVEFFLKEKG